MTNRRRAAVISAVVAGIASLAACDKPSPYTTMTVGSDSVHSEAVCYNDGEKLSESQLRECQREQPAETITVPNLEQVRIGVDPEVAEKGWYIAVNGSGPSEVFKETYVTYPAMAFFQVAPQARRPGDDVTVTIVQAKEPGTDGYGVWRYRLKPSS